MESNIENPLVLVGQGVRQYFNSKFQPTKILDLKFLIIKEVNNDFMQMLLMQMHNPHQLHGTALLEHMENNDISEIIVNGGGQVIFHPNESILFYGKSYVFGTPCQIELMKFCKTIWPSMTTTSNIDSIRKDIKLEGERFNKIQIIKKLADH